MTNRNEKYDDVITVQSSNFSLEIALIKAVIDVESSFREDAYRFEPGFYDRYIKDKPRFVSHRYYNNPEIISASYGLMQVMFTTAEELGFNGSALELYDPKLNIMYGCKLLRIKINHFGVPLGILAYNSGSPRTGDPKKEKNYSYLKKVAKKYNKFGGTNIFILEHK